MFKYVIIFIVLALSIIIFWPTAVKLGRDMKKYFINSIK